MPAPDSKPEWVDQLILESKTTQAAVAKVDNRISTLSTEVSHLTATTDRQEQLIQRQIRDTHGMERRLAALELHQCAQACTPAPSAQRPPWVERRKCYNCGEIGHIQRNCTKGGAHQELQKPGNNAAAMVTDVGL